MMLIDIECTCGGSKIEGGTNTGGKCKHSEKSLNICVSRKTVYKFGIHRECETCEKENKIKPPTVEEGIEPCPPSMWMCLQCGNQACGRSDRSHAIQHFKVPRTGLHCLVLDTYQWKLWCYECNSYINPDSCIRASRVVCDIERMANSPKATKMLPNLSKKKNLVELKKVKPKFLFGFSKVVGLTNLGNTCFFNAVLQCLAQTPFLVKVLEDMQKPGQTFVLPGGAYKKPGSTEEISLPPIEGVLDKECPLTQVLQKTLTDMQNSNSEPYKPSELLNILRKKSSQCMDGGQHDAHELLRHLLEHVRSEDLRRYQQIILKNLNLWGQSSKNNDDDKISRLKFYGHQASARLLGPEPVFKGILVSTLECLECHHSSPRTEPFLDLSLPVMADKPQPPSHRRKSSGFEDAFDLMNSNSNTNNSSSTGYKSVSRRAANYWGKSRNTKQKNMKNNQTTISEENNTHENNDDVNNDLVDSENSKTEKTKDYSASGSESDIEDNVDTESGTEQLSKQQEILESGYSSEKPSTLVSPLSPVENSHNNDTTKSLNSFTVTNNDDDDDDDDGCPPLENGDNDDDSQQKEIKTNNIIVVNNHNNNNNNNNSQGVELNSKKEEKLVTQLLASNVNEKMTENNSINNSSENSLLSSSSPVEEKEVNDEKMENGKEDEEESLKYAPEAKNDENIISKIEKKTNNDNYSNTNGAEKLKTGVSRTGLNNHHVNQSPTRYTTCEGEFSIQSCLNQFTAQELMANNNAVGCEECTARENKGKENGKMVRTPRTKQYLISNVPAVLILHLKRFQSQRMSFSKVTKPVKFPTILNLAPVCKNHDEPKVYSLYGVVEHSGTLYGGHYVAYVKTRQPLTPNDPRWSFLPKQESTDSEKLASDVNDSQQQQQTKSEENTDSSNIEPLPGRWYNISDSRVIEVDENQVLQSQAYLLFYERIL
ncbi:ubiquitin carboxyl-terminal hydrolase 45 [Leptopilina boulardi]|uniref:ubiquitin carboxyl-terminal hydrolase 45 n=1 Tax=Leptopilina boulardi TaxID=63433 RepID=UPI0021F68809|nr:ubiquitin carboxyl-terminal hydrolase 45 [Leptopilina boulardi]